MGEPGLVDGRHYTEYVERVKELKRAGNLDAAEKLLVRLIDAVEQEAKAKEWPPAPWYYKQLAIVYRKKKDYAAEMALHKRWARWGVDTSADLEKAQRRLGG